MNSEYLTIAITVIIVFIIVISKINGKKSDYSNSDEFDELD